jgi:hypothetical protein
VDSEGFSQSVMPTVEVSSLTAFVHTVYCVLVWKELSYRLHDFITFFKFKSELTVAVNGP